MEKSNITSFGVINCEEKLLKRLQIGDIRLGRKIPIKKLEVEININISNKDYNRYFQTEETGYFELDNKLFYRNCNIVSNTDGYYVIYKGILPNSFLEVTLNNQEKFIADINVSKNYLIESRSRFTKNASFEEFVNNLFIVMSILRGKIPLHSAGCFLSQNSDEVILFMGYPNTGKTTTSYNLSKKLNSEYLSEDIVFLDMENKEVYSCPNTSNNFDIKKFEGKLKYFVPLKRKKDKSEKSLFNFIHTMNLYEFFWNQDLIIRHLFSSIGENFNLSDIEMKYIEDLEKMASFVEVIDISNVSREEWVNKIYEIINNK